jgi:proteasome lid subunit RPN8/RPN11
MRIDTRTRERLFSLARGGAPEEVCGVLGGRDEPERVVTGVHPVSNVAEDPRTRYELDPEETYRIIEELEERGDDVLGFYHSHPAGPDEPSETDRELATWEGKVYCIVSLADEPTIGAWVWTGTTFESVAVRSA